MSVIVQPTEGIAVPELTGAPKAIARRGLSSADARHRLATFGSNAIADVAQHPVPRALRKLWAPVPWMLEAVFFLQLFLGDYVEAGVVAVR